MRSNEEIVEQTNELARIFYQLLGYEVPASYRFYDRRSNIHPHAEMCWLMACEAQAKLTSTDVNDVLADME